MMSIYETLLRHPEAIRALSLGLDKMPPHVAAILNSQATVFKAAAALDLQIPKKAQGEQAT
jgi:hypothetical protein